MKKVAIDIGHACRTGASCGGVDEHECAAALAPLLADRLHALGYASQIFDFPNVTNSEDLAKTASAINAADCDIAVSLHFDAADTADAHGAHVVYISVAGRALAQCIAEPLAELLPGRAYKTVCRSLYILRRTKCPAVLVEGGFITSPRDRSVIVQRTGDIASAIAKGIHHYFSTAKA